MPGYLANLAKRGTQILPVTRRRVFVPTIAVALPRAGQEGAKLSSGVGGKSFSTAMGASESRLAGTLPATGSDVDSGKVRGGRRSERDYQKGASHAVVEDQTSHTGIAGADREGARNRVARVHREQDISTTPFSKAVQVESATSGNGDETARQHRGQARDQECSDKRFLKLPPKIEVVMGGDKPAARSTGEPLRPSAPMPSDRSPRVTAERVTSTEPRRVERNAAERVQLEPRAPRKLQIAASEKVTRMVENPEVPRPIARALTDGEPVIQKASPALAQAVPVARRSERANASLDGFPRLSSSSPGPGMERKQESPRLNIGRLEIQIIQEGAQGAGAVQNSAREGSGDAWERMDREHTRQLGGL